MKFGIIQKMIATAIVALVIFGCTRHSSNDSPFLSAGSSSAIASYFPSTEGWINAYNVTSYGNASTLTFYVGDNITIAGQNAYRWIFVPSLGTPDTNYVVVGSRALLVYQDSVSSPEHLLQLPLTTGASWLRFPELADDTQDTTSILTDITGGNPDTTTGPIVRKLLPIVGGNELTVVGVENVILSNNMSFTQAIKISNTDHYGNVNSYWFAAGVGLVKYVIGETSPNSGGVTVGEIYNYGQR